MSDTPSADDQHGTIQPQPEQQIIRLSLEAFEAVLSDFYDRDHQLFRRVPGERYPHKEDVDLYAISAYAEALISDEIDGDLWNTLSDLEETAPSEEEAWAKIKAFYLARGYMLLYLGEGEEWIFAPEVLRQLGLLM